MGHPVMRDLMARDAMLGQLMGALGVSISLYTLGAGKLGSVAEGTEATPTNLSTSNSSTVTPGRRAYARDLGDMGLSINESMLRGAPGNRALAIMVYEGWRLWGNDLVDRIAALAASASNEIGTTGTPLTFEAMDEGMMAFKNRGAGNGPALGLLSEKGANDLNADSRSLGGAPQFGSEAAQATTRLGNGAYLGQRWGVDWFLSSELDTDGGDTLGIVFTAGSFLMKHQRVPLGAGAIQLSDVGFFTQELRRAGGGITRVETASHNAIGILEQPRFAAVRYSTT